MRGRPGERVPGASGEGDSIRTGVAPRSPRSARRRAGRRRVTDRSDIRVGRPRPRRLPGSGQWPGVDLTAPGIELTGGAGRSLAFGPVELTVRARLRAKARPALGHPSNGGEQSKVSLCLTFHNVGFCGDGDPLRDDERMGGAVHRQCGLAFRAPEPGSGERKGSPFFGPWGARLMSSSMASSPPSDPRQVKETRATPLAILACNLSPGRSPIRRMEIPHSRRPENTSPPWRLSTTTGGV